MIKNIIFDVYGTCLLYTSPWIYTIFNERITEKSTGSDKKPVSYTHLDVYKRQEL